MVSKAEKVFFAVVIAFLAGTAIFWKEVRSFLSGTTQEAKTEEFKIKDSQKDKSEKEEGSKEDPFAAASNIVQRWRLPSELKEISGLAAAGDYLWAVSDNPKRAVVKMDRQGNIIQQLTLNGVRLEDAEALASDGRYLYIGDVGDNKGDRQERKIYRVALASIGTDKEVTANADVITFSFNGQTVVDKKKKNEFDCEAMFYHNGSLYLFTKRRTDKDTELFKLPATPGNQEARSLGVFSTDGMITGAAISPSGTEVALTGYHKGHLFPFILFLKNFTGDSFFRGETERIELSDQELDWQIESISYAANDAVYFACEGTKEIAATLYTIRRNDIAKIHLKR